MSIISIRLLTSFSAFGEIARARTPGLKELWREKDAFPVVQLKAGLNLKTLDKG